MKAIVVAIDKNNGIGAKNDLLWQRDLPADLAHFKKLTTGGSIIMGRRTFESIGRPLPDRENIVVTSKPTGVDGILSAVSIESAYALARYPIFIVGGARLYEATLQDVDILYVTEVLAEFPEATVFFPSIDPKIWKEMSREHHEMDERNRYAYDFICYEKRVS